MYFREIKPIILTIGTVYRGSKVLDGVICGALDKTHLTGEVAALVRSSKHYGQIRVIICDSSNLSKMNPSELASSLKKPIIVIRDQSEFNELYMLNYEGLTIEPIGLSASSAKRVLSVISQPPIIPVLSTAKLISTNLSYIPQGLNPFFYG